MESRKRKLRLLLGGLFILMSLLDPRAWASYSIAQAKAFQLPDTGQTKCYDDHDEIPCSHSGEAFYGQDCNHNGPQPTFRDNGDGTVTDLNTGLMWQQDDSHNIGVCERSLEQGVAYCAALKLGGEHWFELTDWRLPTKRELVSLVDLGVPRPGPTINTTYFPQGQATYYLSITVSARCPDICAWGVDFSNGYVEDHMLKTGYVRCVRP